MTERNIIEMLAGKSAGVYFAVTDNSQVAEIEEAKKLRVVFINSKKGPINNCIIFPRNASSSVLNLFGTAKNNTGVNTVLDMLTAGPVGVINLRKITDLDKTGILSFPVGNPDEDVFVSEMPYSLLYNKMAFWNIEPVNLAEQKLNSDVKQLLKFSNSGSEPFSVFVKRSDNPQLIHEDYNDSLAECSLEISDFESIDPDTLLKDTFVDVYIFKNKFILPNTNIYYGHLFNPEIKTDDLSKLAQITASGFVKKISGTLIPGTTISIDEMVNNYTNSIGIVCNCDEFYLDDHALDLDITKHIHDIPAITETEVTAGFVNHTINPVLSYNKELKLDIVKYDSTTNPPYPVPEKAISMFSLSDIEGTDELVVFRNHTVFIDDKFLPNDGIGYAKVINFVNSDDGKIKVIFDKAPKVYELDSVNYYGKVNFEFIENQSYLITKSIDNYVLNDDQFLNGTATRQKEILDLMLTSSIIKGLKDLKGLRYFVDGYKSYVENNYKNQYITLVDELEKRKVYTNAILNDFHVGDLIESGDYTDSLGEFNIEYLPTGGSPSSSSKVLKPSVGTEYKVYYFGPGYKKNRKTWPIAGLVSNLFYRKAHDYSIVGNETGVMNVGELEYNFDEIERASLEAFRYNPIVFFNNSFRVFGIKTAKVKRSKLQQIHNSELLTYIKNNIYVISKSKVLANEDYSYYDRLRNEVENFMSNLKTVGAIIQYTVVCERNAELSNNGITLINVSFTPTNAQEKIFCNLLVN